MVVICLTLMRPESLPSLSSLHEHCLMFGTGQSHVPGSPWEPISPDDTMSVIMVKYIYFVLLFHVLFIMDWKCNILVISI